MNYEYLPRSTPEFEGVSREYYHELLKHLKQNDVEVHNLYSTINGKVVFTFDNLPYSNDRPHILHSLTKLFTNTAVAQANQEGLINLTDKVVSFFEDDSDIKLPDDLTENAKAMTIEDLITMRSGHDREISGSEWRPLKTSWTEAFFKEPVVHTPGKHYCYSSACSYLLSAIVQKVTGKSAHKYLEDGILRKLGIDSFTWDISPEGVNSGGNGITLRVEDVLKIALLYSQNGKWNGEQLLNEDWVNRAFGRSHNKAKEDNQTKYNFHLFEYGDVYTASGIFGQNAMIIPKLNMVVVVFAATVDWETVPIITNEKFVQPLLKKNDSREKELSNKGASDIFIVDSLQHGKKSKKMIQPFNTHISSYLIDENEDNIEKLGFQMLDSETLIFHMKDDRGYHKVHMKIDEWSSCVSSITGNYLHHQYQSNNAHLVTKAWWETNSLLCMEMRFIGTSFCDYYMISFDGNYQNLKMKRFVNVNTQATERKEIYGKRESSIDAYEKE